MNTDGHRFYRAETNSRDPAVRDAHLLVRHWETARTGFRSVCICVHLWFPCFSAASFRLTPEPVTLENLPAIADGEVMQQILRTLGVRDYSKGEGRMRKAEKRAFSEVDLRWGIGRMTNEKWRMTNPLGERYGWVPMLESVESVLLETCHSEAQGLPFAP